MNGKEGDLDMFELQACKSLIKYTEGEEADASGEAPAKTMSDILLLQVTDSTEVMQNVVKLLDIPHVPCLNHCFALDVNKMDKANSPISVHCQKICEALQAVKRSIKNVAVLRSFTDLKV